jgi:hypothetical protein
MQSRALGPPLTAREVTTTPAWRGATRQRNRIVHRFVLVKVCLEVKFCLTF